jgi:plastocyanin
MGNLGQVAVGIIVLLVVVGGLLFIFYSRTNAVEKTGYGSLIMLALVSLMIPVFWIMESGSQAAAQNQQQATAIEQGMQLYAQNCPDRCYGIDSKNNVVNPSYLGYTFAQLNSMNDDQLKSVITGGFYNPTPSPGVPAKPANANAIPRSDQFGGQLEAIYIDYLFAFFRSTDAQYVKQQGYTGPAAQNGLKLLPDYLQANLPAQYKAATTFAQTGQFGAAVDMTKQSAITIDIVQNPPTGATCTPNCFQYLNLKVKVGTVITWVNKTDQPHTVTAKDQSGNDAAQIFDSGVKTPIQTNGTFKYTVTDAAYNLNPDTHTVLYYCIIHPQMVAQLTIVK